MKQYPQWVLLHAIRSRIMIPHNKGSITMWTKETIREKLKSDPRWILRGSVAIYRFQTDQERASEATLEDNGVGFNGVDAYIMSSFAEQVINGYTLSGKQLAIAQKKIVKYAGQLTKIANGINQ